MTVSSERTRDQAEMRLRQRVYRLLTGELDDELGVALAAGVGLSALLYHVGEAARHSTRDDAVRLGAKDDRG